ncbi:MAG: tyrosine recombinase XerC [Candidatus Binataceae bacterium]
MAGKRGQNEGSIFRRWDGRWCGILNLGWENGRRKRKHFYGSTAADVREHLLKARTDHSHGLPVAPERQTVGEFLDRWLAESVKPSVRPLTYQQYSAYIRLYITPALGKVQLAKLNPQQVQQLSNALLKRGLSSRTVQLALVILRHALSQAVKWNLAARNVAKLVDTPKVERTEIKPFSPEQAREFVAAVRGKPWSAAYITALVLGLREGELLGLRWVDVDLEARSLRIVQTVQRTKAGRIFARPKTERSRRTLALSESLVAVLRGHKARQAEQRLAAGSDWQDMGLVFTSRIGTPIEVSNLHRNFKGILREAGLPNIRLHDLRHSAASLLLAQGVHARAIMEQLGHSRISVTMDTYAHIMPAMMREVADKMEAILSNSDSVVTRGKLIPVLVNEER